MDQFEIAKLELRDGDKIVVRSKSQLSEESIQNIKRMIDLFAPEHECLVVCNEMDLEVIRSAESDLEQRVRELEVWKNHEMEVRAGDDW